MDAVTTKADDTQGTLTGAKIITAIKQSGVEFILAVPDIVTSKGLLFPIAADKELRLVRVCKEDECVGIASGLTYCDKRALILIQYTGFLDSLNAIRAVAVEYKQPIVDRLHRELKAIIALPEVQQEYVKTGRISVDSPPPEELLAFMRSEIVRLGKVVESAGIARSQ